jgi:hypothetical protein
MNLRASRHCQGRLESTGAAVCSKSMQVLSNKHQTAEGSNVQVSLRLLQPWFGNYMLVADTFCTAGAARV